MSEEEVRQAVVDREHVKLLSIGTLISACLRPSRGKGLIGALGALVLFCAVGGRAAEPSSDSLVHELNRYSGYIARALQASELASLDKARLKAAPEVQSLITALLYRADPSKYRPQLSQHFTVHDYASRARGEVVEITQEEFISKLKQLEQVYPSLNPSPMLLVSFTRFRDANLWFQQGGQRISVARFLRGAFLSVILKGSDQDAVAVANRLDQEARQQFEKDAATKR